MTNPHLYSRVDLMTGADIKAPTYEVYSRTFLRAAPGTSGNKQHRRYDGNELALLLILNPLNGFGVPIAELARVAVRFHAAIDWFRENGIPGHEEAAEILIEARRRMAKDGDIDLKKLSTMPGWAGNRPLKRVPLPPRGATRVKWSGLVEWLEIDGGFDIPTELATACEQIDTKQWDEHALRYFAVADEQCSLNYVRKMHWYRGPDGELMDSYEDPDPGWESYLTVDVALKKRRVLGLKVPRRLNTGNPPL